MVKYPLSIKVYEITSVWSLNTIEIPGQSTEHAYDLQMTKAPEVAATVKRQSYLHISLG